MIKLRPFEYKDAQIIADGAVDPVSSRELTAKLIRRRYRDRRNVTHVAEYKMQPVGCLIWQINNSQLNILNCAFHPGLRKQIIPVFTSEIRGRLSNTQTRIIMNIRENDEEECINLFRGCEFHFLEESPLIYEYYKDPYENAWVMECTKRINFTAPAPA